MTTDSAPAARSVDPREVAYYSALAERWWDHTGPFWPLHRLNKLRIGYIQEMLCNHYALDPAAPRPLTGLALLDIGCGGGILSEALAECGATVHGIDVVEKNIQIARLHAAHSDLDIRYDTMTAESLAAGQVRYDAVLNMEVVEHVADLPGFMRACNALVKPGGLHIIATLNRTAAAWLTAIIGAEYVLGWLPRGTHRWQQFRQPAELRALLAQDGLQIKASTGVRVNPVTRQMKLSSYQGINYMMVAERP